MSRTTGNKSAPARKNGSTLLIGILIGMVLGVGMAAGLAWFIAKSPSPFVQKERAISKLPIEIAPPAESSVGAASDVLQTTAVSGVMGSKPRFEFYKVLTDKPEATEREPAKSADKQPAIKPRAVESRPLAADEPYFLQAGSFSKAGDAEKLKARLALLGFESNTQTATIPDKGVWHRVRLGPYKNADEMNQARNLLKQNGLEATPMRAP